MNDAILERLIGLNHFTGRSCHLMVDTKHTIRVVQDSFKPTWLKGLENQKH